MSVIVVILGTILGILLAAASWAIEGLIAMLLWNWIIVGLFGVAPISFWVGVGVAMVLNFIGRFFKGRTIIKKD